MHQIFVQINIHIYNFLIPAFIRFSRFNFSYYMLML